MMEFDILENQERCWARLIKIASSGKTGNAYLFTGPPGSGKEGLSILFAQYLNCSNPKKKSCENCSSCYRFKNLQHERLHLLFPLPRATKRTTDTDSISKIHSEVINEQIKKKSFDFFHKIKIKKANRILIDSVREIRKKLFLKSNLSGRKVVIIFDSHLMCVGQAETANSLLKILEEPPNNTTFILVTDFKDLLNSTIISRCQEIRIPRLTNESIQNWTKLSSFKKDQKALVVGLSFGNLHEAKKLIKRPLKEWLDLIDNMVNTYTTPNAEKWNLFIQGYGKLAIRDPELFEFHMKLSMIWFLSLYRLKSDTSHILHDTDLKSGLKIFLSKYPNTDLLKISLILGESKNALKNNLYMPLFLTNLLIDVQGNIKE